MLAILPFLIQWIALGQLGSQVYIDRPVQTSYPLPKSHWTLLHEFQQLPEEEIDYFLPQVCNMMMDRESLGDDDLFEYFESVIERKCGECFTFGTRVCGVLKATQQTPSEGLFKSILTPNALTQRIEERLRAFQERAEYATAYGHKLSPEVSEVRGTYYRDYQFLLDSLARLGTELKSFPVARRNMHLRHAISQFNALLYYRMASRGSVSSMETPLQDFRTYPDLSAHNIAALMPAAAQYSLHLPLHHCQDKVQRILRFVESECEVLPSKERCPYVVVVEVLEQSFDCKSEQLYTQGVNPSVYLPSGVANGQILHNGQAKLPISSPSAVTPTSVDALTESVDQRNSHSLEVSMSHQQTTTKGSSVHSIPRSSSRGKLLASNLESSKATAGHYSSRYRRGHRRYHSPASPSIASSSDQQSLDDSMEQLQEAYELYDEASDSAASARAAESQAEAEAVDLDELTPPVLQVKPSNKNHNTHVFARPDVPHSKRDHEVHMCEVVEAEGETSERKQGASDCDEPIIVNSLRGGGSSADEHPASSTNVPDKRTFPRAQARRRRIRSPTALPQQQEPNTRPPSPPPSQYDEVASDEIATARKVFLSESLGNPGEYFAQPRNNQYFGDSNGHGNGDENWRRDPIGADNEHSNVIDARPHRSLHDPHHPHHPHHPHLQSATGLPHPHSLQPPRAYVRPRTWQERKAVIRASSPFGKLPGWDMKSFIVKSGDDLRKEVLAMQLMEFCKKVFEMEGLDIYLRPYQILSTGAQAGLVEFLEGAESVDKIKKALPRGMTLKSYFELSFGESYSFFYAKAVQNFVRSLVGYSLLTYLVQVKDRHNANILFDQEGHVLHIDFGYILGDSPGFNINFESAPFKLTREYLEIMGGVDSEAFKTFQDLFLRGFLALQKHIDGITSIIQLFYGDKRRAAADGVRSRLLFPQSQAEILALIGDSLDNWRTKQYDWYQERTNNIQT